LWTPKGKSTRQLRWQSGHAANQPSLTVDSRGCIVVGGADDLSRASLSRNMRQEASRLLDHQDHHIVPIAVARDHKLFQHARTRGGWDPNHAANGIQLPTNEAARKAVVQSHGLPIHNGSHRVYSRDVSRRASRVADELRDEFGSLDKVPAERVMAEAQALVNDLRHELYNRAATKGDVLR